jgi:aryl-alcohol dehydrogenase-like predicted oxidoreductase
VIISKGGYLVAEPDLVQGSESARRYLTKTYIETGLVDRARLSNGSSLDATFMLDQLQRSRTNLGLETIDFFLVQEPELHLRACGPDEFQRRLTLLFQALEGAARSGQIGAYGICSWDGFLVPYSERGHLSLVEIFAAALAAGSADHHLRAIQLPYGLARVDAAALLSQLSPHAQSSPLIEMLPNSGTVVLASAPLQGGRILGRVPDSLREAYPEAQSDAQCCLQFVRSTSGIDCAVVGMREPPHLADNLALARCAPAKPALAAELIARSVSPA